MTDKVEVTKRIQVMRLPDRAVYDVERIHAILDEAFVCHVGFVLDGQPYVIPTAYARAGNQIYFHGSAASRMQRSLARGLPVCVTVTLVDGLVLARSAFHHSINYRSLVILGTARLVDDPAEKLEALRCFTNHVIAGRWEQVRPPNEKELRATNVLALSLDEASAKVRAAPPKDDEEDLAIPAWAGVVPLQNHWGQPVPDDHVSPSAARPDPAKFERVRA